MKHSFTLRLFACLAALLLLWPTLASAAPFTPGNVIIARVGDGSAALTSAATAVFLDEYTPGGTLVQSIALPTAVAGSNRVLTASGTSTSELSLTRSADGRYLVLAGYDAAPGTAGVSGTTSAAVSRVIARIAADGTLDTSTSIGDAFSATSIRAATTVDGLNFYAVGGNSGVRYTPFGNPAATATVALNAAPTNVRAVNTFGGSLYITSGSSPNVGVGQLGTGLPTTSGQTNALLTGTNSTSPYAFYFADLSATVAGVDVLYVADDNAAAGAIQKYSLVAGTWTLNGTVGPASAAVRGLAGSVTGTTVSLFTTSQGSLYTLTDNAGYNAAPSTTTLPAAIATAPTNGAFRGAAFAPVSAVVTPVPTVASFTPASGPVGTIVTVTGTNLAGATGATLNGTPVTGFMGMGATSVMFDVPVGATTGPIAVTTPSGTATSATSFTVTTATNPVPVITSLTPGSVVAGAGAFTVVITGTGFLPTSLVSSAAPVGMTTYISATQLSVMLPAGAVVGTYPFTVTNPAPGGGASNTVGFVVTAAPVLTSISPNTAVVGGAAFLLTATGLNFTAASAIRFNGVTLATTLVSATSLTATVPATALATAGVVPVAIITSAPGGTTSGAVSFTITGSGAAPTITSFTPARAVAGAGFTLVVNGTNLVAGTTINFNGASYTGTILGTTGTGYTVVIPSGGVPAVGTYPITATNTGGTSAALSFLIVAPVTSASYEDFEQGTKGTYATATVTLRSGDWTFTDALLGNQFNDKVNQVQSARIRGGSIAMNFDKPNGAGIVTLSAAIYGTDATASLVLEISTNGGTTYTTVAGAPAALTTTLTPYTFTVNRAGNVRLRISSTNTVSGSNPRINIDDLTITNFIGAATLASQALPGLAVFPNPATDRLTVALPTAGAATVALRDLTGRVVLAPAALGADKQLLLPATLARGLYLLEVTQGGVTAVRRIEKN